MKALVVYDTYYGNTKAVAETIADELHAEGLEAEVRNVRERHSPAPDADILFVGSPVRMGSVTGKIKRYVKHLDEGLWKDKPVVVFTTTLKLPEDASDEQRRNQDKWDWGAGRKLRDLATSKGLSAVGEPLWVEVEGMKGPLVESGLDKTRQYTREAIQAVGVPA